MSKAEISCVHLVYFSPSGSTEKIVRKIASAIKGPEVKIHNLLPFAARQKQYSFGKNDLVIYGSLSAGMLFTKAEELFNCLEGNETPFIGVISYGNAYYGVALTEMKERAENRGFKVCALGAFIAQHTMAPEVGTGRPDAKDEEIMLDFGRRAYEKVLAGDYNLENQPGTNWSSSEEFNKYIAFRETNKDPYCFPLEFRAKKISDDCIKCYTCVKNCPTNAIDIENKTFDLEACIGCYGCINRCPQHAINSTSPEVTGFMQGFIDAFKNDRLEPDMFF
ncbi:MAG: EFR1 family ferrodoxin [Anaerovibrio sp.]|uniref:EFR1 family ferrodoxin n=1 Tax=Anaerovibrio sp. TaxID=1872532 RepID=UPI0025F8A040|nr:EFR1 family ferrodoxin [Anaerovibrio sp.]MCR5177222.1 EFR1 family ferrodoxin [Anaerovibrio sp.]